MKLLPIVKLVESCPIFLFRVKMRKRREEVISSFLPKIKKVIWMNTQTFEELIPSFLTNLSQFLICPRERNFNPTYRA